MSDYLILSQDTPVAKWENNRLTVLNEQRLPLFLKRVANADMWLETRAIDSHRANSRLLKKALRLTDRDVAYIFIPVKHKLRIKKHTT